MTITSAQHPVHSTAVPSAPAAAVTVDTSGGDVVEKSKKDKGGGGDRLELPSPPDYFDHRIKIFEKVKAEYETFVKITAYQPRQEVQVTKLDSLIRKATTWERSPMDIAKEVLKGSAEHAVIAKVNGQLWDLERPLEGSCKLQIIDFEGDEGPPTEDGFYYEVGTETTDRNILESDIKPLEDLSNVVIKEKQKFERPKETL